jgi:DNA-binding NarL/FixJ family response regulator
MDIGILAAVSSGSSARVILVNPEPSVREQLGRLLRGDHAVVVEAASVDGAVAAARQHRPTVIVTALTLEGDPYAAFRLAVEAKYHDPCLQTVIYLDTASNQDIRRRARRAAVLVVQAGQLSALLSAVSAAHATYEALASPRESAAGDVEQAGHDAR